MKTTTVALSSVTLLNASYEPLGKVSFKQAVRMLFREVDVPPGRLLPDGSAEARPTPVCLLRPTGSRLGLSGTHNTPATASPRPD